MNKTDSRKVSTDALETLGMIIDETQKRDAIHLAVCPVVAAQDLKPGQDVGADGTVNNPVGIVDPFLKQEVRKGERFWLVIYPRQINSLRHVWSHPAFEEEESEILKNIRRQIIEIGGGIQNFPGGLKSKNTDEREKSKKWLENSCVLDKGSQFTILCFTTRSEMEGIKKADGMMVGLIHFFSEPTGEPVIWDIYVCREDIWKPLAGWRLDSVEKLGGQWYARISELGNPHD